MNLYQLNDCMKQAEDALNDGATPEEVAEAIAAIKMERPTMAGTILGKENITISIGEYQKRRRH